MPPNIHPGASHSSNSSSSKYYDQEVLSFGKMPGRMFGKNLKTSTCSSASYSESSFCRTRLRSLLGPRARFHGGSFLRKLRPACQSCNQAFTKKLYQALPLEQTFLLLSDQNHHKPSNFLHLYYQM